MVHDFEGWGVLYMVWGDSHDQMLQRSIDSLKKYHPDLPVHVNRIQCEKDVAGSHAMLLEKSAMFRLSPFQNTLFLDADTVVMGRLDHAFAMATRFGLACCICECPWARRYTGLKNEHDLVEYNTGVLFFTRQAEPLFSAWEHHARSVDSSIYHLVDGQLRVMQHNDQASFAKAVEMTGFNPYVLPLNWNYRPRWQRSFFGPIKIWHDGDPPLKQIYEICEYYANEEPIVGYFSLGA